MFPSFKSFPTKIQLIKNDDTNDIKKKRKKKARKEYSSYANDGELKSILNEDLLSTEYRIDKQGNDKIRKYQEIRDEAVPLYKRSKLRVKDHVEKRLKYKEFSRKQTIPMINHSNSIEENRVDSGFDDDYIELPQDTIDLHTSNTPSTSKVADYNQKLKRDPKNTKLWLEFIQYQDEIEGKNAIGKKLAILEKAMNINDDSELILKYMELFSEVEDEKTVATQWDQILSDNPPFEIWIEYLEFKTKSEFQYTEICELYAEIMYNFSSDGDEQLLHLFYRVCWLQRQCGYDERGIAMFQALLEYNLSTEDDIEKFWDSEEPRFGEIGSRTFNLQRLSNTDVEVQNSTYIEPRNWYEKELLSQKDWLPLRNSFQEEIEDPFRTVLFDDVHPYLFIIKNASSIQQLISQFLIYLGLPFGNTLSTNTLISKDYLLHDEIIQNQELWDYSKDIPQFPINTPLQLPGSLMQFTNHWPQLLNNINISNDKLKFIRQILEQGGIFFENKSIPKSYLLLLDYSQDKERFYVLIRARKQAKELLRTEPSNLNLWNLFAHFVRNSANWNEKSSKILNTTILMLDKIPKENLNGVNRIYGTLAEVFISQKNSGKAIEALVASTTNSILKTVTSGEIEQTRRFYRDKLQTMMDIRFIDEFQSAFYNYCLLELLNNPIEDAGKPMYEIANNLPTDSMCLEICHEIILFTTLMYTTSFGTFQSSIIIQILDKCLALFPRNTVFLSVYVSTQSKFLFDNRLRRSLKEKLNSNPSEILWLVMVWTESIGTKNPNLIRAVFDDALQSSRYFRLTSRKGMQIFMLAIKFEIYCQDFQRAKRIFHHAISEFPWVKSLYLLAFDGLESVFNKEEKLELVQSMEEKEIRFRVPFTLQ